MQTRCRCFTRINSIVYTHSFNNTLIHHFLPCSSLSPTLSLKALCQTYAAAAAAPRATRHSTGLCACIRARAWPRRSRAGTHQTGLHRRLVLDMPRLLRRQRLHVSPQLVHLPPSQPSLSRCRASTPTRNFPRVSPARSCALSPLRCRRHRSYAHTPKAADRPHPKRPRRLSADSGSA